MKIIDVFGLSNYPRIFPEFKSFFLTNCNFTRKYIDIVISTFWGSVILKNEISYFPIQQLVLKTLINVEKFPSSSKLHSTVTEVDLFLKCKLSHLFIVNTSTKLISINNQCSTECNTRLGLVSYKWQIDCFAVLNRSRFKMWDSMWDFASNLSDSALSVGQHSKDW